MDSECGATKGACDLPDGVSPTDAPGAVTGTECSANSDCSSPLVCKGAADAGTCDGATGGGTSCGQLQTCLGGCQTQQCQTDCLDAASTQAYNKLIDAEFCLIGKCLDCSNPTPQLANACQEACIQIVCGDELDACFGDDDCAGINSCLAACGQGDQACQQACFQAAPAAAQSLFQGVAICVQQNGSQCGF
jgi:hypothetical protein